MIRRLTLARKISQTFFLLLFIYILWSTTYPLSGWISPDVIFKINPAVMLITAITERMILPGIIFSFIMLGLTLVLGRFFCGWICPLGTLIDMSGKIPFKKKIVGYEDQPNKRLRGIKYYMIGLIVVFALAGIQVIWVLDPIVLISRVVSLAVIPFLTQALDQGFITLIQNFELFQGPVYDLYSQLRGSLLAVNTHFFSHGLIALLVFFIILLAAVKVTRLWCRMLCPLGSVYAGTSQLALMKRYVDSCIQCNKCQRNCRMGAIHEDISYDKGECILCMDCVYDCPEKSTHFRFRSPLSVPMTPTLAESGYTRRDFLCFLASSTLLFTFKKSLWAADNQVKPIIRPPGSLPEEPFVDTCIRCGNCLKVCLTNGLQPALLESGWDGIWTPNLVPEIGYCEYNCTLCTEVCPTGAIRELNLKEKHQARIGVASIDQSICYAWAGKKNCIVCEEHCPVPDKAIGVIPEIVKGEVIYKPFVKEDLCVGCGICQNKCPVRPLRAIRVQATLDRRR